LNKILITIQGRTLILYYQIKQGLPRQDQAQSRYIQVLPSDELSKFDLKGLTPEMFCVNIADLVNFRGQFSGQVENERQIPVARWVLNEEEYRQMMSEPIAQLTHQEIVKRLEPLAGYIKESDHQYIAFEERVVTYETADAKLFAGYRITIATEDIEGSISTDAFFSLDTCTAQGWIGKPPPSSHYEAIRLALNNKLQEIKDTGVQISHLVDETDYALA